MEIIGMIQSWSYPIINLVLLIYCIVKLRNRGGEFLAGGFGIELISSLTWRIVNAFELYQNYEHIYELLNHVNFFFNLIYAGLFIAGITLLASSTDTVKEGKMNHVPKSFGELYFSFEGRINRAKLWLHQGLILNLIVGFCIVIGGLMGGKNGDGVIAGYIIGILLVLWPWVALSMKRCHDRNRSGAFVLVSLVPFISIWYAVEVLFLQGTDGDNEYGSDPLTPISATDAETS